MALNGSHNAFTVPPRHNVELSFDKIIFREAVAIIGKCSKLISNGEYNEQFTSLVLITTQRVGSRYSPCSYSFDFENFFRPMVL